MKKSLFLFLFVFCGVSQAQPPSTDAALAAFNQRAFISANDASNKASSAQDIVGQYIIRKADGSVVLLSDHANDPKTNTTVELKQRAVFHKLYDKTWSVTGAILSFLNLSMGSDTLREVTITDLISVSNPDVTTSNCLTKKPAILSSSDTYYCVTAITLSQIATREYKKFTGSAQGSYVATASGSYQENAGAEGLQFAISLSTTPGIKNGSIVAELVPQAAAHNAMPMRMSLPPKALQGMIIRLQKK